MHAQWRIWILNRMRDAAGLEGGPCKHDDRVPSISPSGPDPERRTYAGKDHTGSWTIWPIAVLDMKWHARSRYCQQALCWELSLAVSDAPHISRPFRLSTQALDPHSPSDSCLMDSVDLVLGSAYTWWSPGDALMPIWADLSQLSHWLKRDTRVNPC